MLWFHVSRWSVTTQKKEVDRAHERDYDPPRRDPQECRERRCREPDLPRPSESVAESVSAPPAAPLDASVASAANVAQDVAQGQGAGSTAGVPATADVASVPPELLLQVMTEVRDALRNLQAPRPGT